MILHNGKQRGAIKLIGFAVLARLHLKFYDLGIVSDKQNIKTYIFTFSNNNTFENILAT